MLGTAPIAADVQPVARSGRNPAVTGQNELALAALIPPRISKAGETSLKWAEDKNVRCPDAAALASAILVAGKLGAALTVPRSDLDSGPALHRAASGMWATVPHRLDIAPGLAEIVEQIVPESTVAELVMAALGDGMPVNDALREMLRGNPQARTAVIEKCLAFALGEYERQTDIMVGSCVRLVLPFFGVCFDGVAHHSEAVQRRVRAACHALSEVFMHIATPDSLLDWQEAYFGEGMGMDDEQEELNAIQRGIDGIRALWAVAAQPDAGESDENTGATTAQEQVILTVCERMQAHAADCLDRNRAFAEPDYFGPLIPLIFPENSDECFSPQFHYEGYCSEIEDTFCLQASQSLVPLYRYLQAYATAMDLLIELSEKLEDGNQ